MDFHSLARKELQALCKKNKIPANMTNIAMADALKALEKVEGLDELNNAPRSDPQESPEKTINAAPRTACRTSTRRKPSTVEPESSQPKTRTRYATRKMVAEETEQENENVNLLETPAMPTTRRRAPAASATRNMEAQLMEIGEDEKLLGPEKSDVPETPAMRTSRRKAPAVSTRKQIEDQKDEKSVQRVYSTRQSVRLLEKSMAELSLKEKRTVEAVKIEGLCEKTKEVEQKNDVPECDSQLLSFQNIDESSENESGKKHGIQEDNNSNNKEGEGLEVLSWENLERPLGNESEMKHEFEEHKTVYEMDNSPVSLQIVSLENASEMKNELNVHNDIADHEVNSEVLGQNIDQLPKSESETKLQGGEKIEHEVEMQVGFEACTNLDNDSGLEKDDEDNSESSDASFFLQVETSGKPVDMNCESTDEKGPDVIAENSETLNAAMNPDIEKELNSNQDCLIVEVYDDSSVLGMETIVPDEVSFEVSLTPEVPEAMGKSSEMNLMDDEQHGINDLHSDAATEEGTDANAIKEVSDGRGSDKVQENDNAENIEEKAPLLPQVDYEKSESINESESHLFTLQHEKCKQASDNLANEYDIDDVNVSEAKEPDMIIAHDQKSPFCCLLVSDSEVAGIIPLADDHEQELAAAAYKYIQTLNKSPTSVKQTSRYQPVVSSDHVTAGMVISSPSATNRIHDQSHLSTESTPRKYSTKKQTSQKIMYPDFNKENIDNSGRKIEPNKDKVKKKVADEEKKFEEISLRQLSKMLKEKLQIANKNNEGTRPALQVLTENCKATGEPENKN